MEKIYTSLPEYIKSGDYFKDARDWYKYKYIYIFSQRSFMFILSAIICVVFFGVVVNIYGLFPVVVQVKYTISADSSDNKTAQIIRANQITNQPLESITDIMVRNYVMSREAYKYSKLKKQFTFVKNNSTRIVFRRFYNFMNIDNPSSPVMRYQKTVARAAQVISIDYSRKNKAIVKFNSIATSDSGKIEENMVWQATIDYEIDKINPNYPSGSRFNFTVTDYQLKLLKDKKKK